MTAEQIKTLRERLGWTQRGMADYLGVNQNTVNRWENGQCKPMPLCLRALQRLAREQEATNG